MMEVHCSVYPIISYHILLYFFFSHKDSLTVRSETHDHQQKHLREGMESAIVERVHLREGKDLPTVRRGLLEGGQGLTNSYKKCT
jgi:hypothetical protein